MCPTGAAAGGGRIRKEERADANRSFQCLVMRGVPPELWVTALGPRPGLQGCSPRKVKPHRAWQVARQEQVGKNLTCEVQLGERRGCIRAGRAEASRSLGRKGRRGEIDVCLQCGHWVTAWRDCPLGRQGSCNQFEKAFLILEGRGGWDLGWPRP